MIGLLLGLCLEPGLRAQTVAIQGPTNVVVPVGGRLTLTASASGAEPVALQWQFEGTDIPGAASGSLSLTNIHASAGGRYRVVANSSAGSAVSGDVWVRVRELVAWGNYEYLTAVPEGATNVVAVAAGAHHALALRRDGTVVAWGSGDSGASTVPVAATNIVHVSAGYDISLAIRDDGSPVRWGLAGSYSEPNWSTLDTAEASQGFYAGVDGDGLPVIWGPTTGTYSMVPFPVAAEEIMQLAVPHPSGRGYCLALRQDGALVAWGSLAKGITSLTPALLTNAVAVAAGGSHAMALLGNGQVLVWGDNTKGQTNVPAAATNIVAIRAGGYHCLALRNDGVLLSWGDRSAPGIGVPSSLGFVSGFDAGPSVSYAIGGTGELRFVARPQSVIANRGYRCILNARAAGLPPLAYRWMHDGAEIPGATEPTLDLGVAEDPIAGEYKVSVVNALGACEQVVATVTVRRAPEVPRVVSQPGALDVTVGDRVEIAVQIEGFPEPQCRWKHAGTNLPVASATNATLVIPYARLSDGGEYTLALTNASGGILSAPVVLTVLSGVGPELLSWPQTQGVALDVPLVLSASARGGADLTYQWQRNGVDIPGATGPTWTVSRFRATDAGAYRVVARDAGGITVSPVADIIALPLAVIGVGTTGVGNVPLAASNAIAVAAGRYHLAALKADGTVICWGANGSNQCDVPRGLRGVVAIGAGALHTLALKADGTVVGWGHLNAGPAKVPPNATNVVAIAVGAAHNLALRADGTVLAWGTNSQGQIDVPASATRVIGISACESQSVALRADNTLVRWGPKKDERVLSSPVVGFASASDSTSVVNADGSIGHLDWTSVFTDGSTSTNANALGVTGAGTYVIALRADGRVVGYCSRSSIPPYFFPSLSSLQSAVAVSCGPGYVAVILSENLSIPARRVTAIASKPGGFLVLDPYCGGGRPYPVRWETPKGVVQRETWRPLYVDRFEAADAGVYTPTMRTGGAGTLGSAVRVTMVQSDAPQIAIQPQGGVFPAGTNVSLFVTLRVGGSAGAQWSKDGKVLDGATGLALSLTNLQSTDVGDYRVVVSNGTGRDESAVARIEVEAAAPVVLVEPSNVQIAPGQTARFEARAVGSEPIHYQWRFGGVPIPDATNRVLLVGAAGPENGGRYSLVATNRLGAATTRDAALSLVSLAGFGPGFVPGSIPVGATGFVQVAQGTLHSLGLRGDGTVFAWGSDTIGNLTVPAAATNVVAVAACGRHSLALRADGSLVAWGRNAYGESVVPVGLSNVVAIACGEAHSLAVRADGTVTAWGRGYYGESVVPPGLTNVVQVTADGGASGALTGDGRVIGWGPRMGTVPAGLDEVVALSDSTALRADGTIVSWYDVQAPVGLKGVAAIACANQYGVGILQDGRLASWGMADGVSVSGLSNVVAASVSPSGSVLAVIADGQPRVFPRARQLDSTMAGEDFAWRVLASGRQPMRYHWFRDGTEIGTTSRPFFVLRNIQTPAAGAYSLRVENSVGSTTVALGELHVNPAAPRFYGAQPSQRVVESDTLLLGQQAIGSGPISYRWLRNGEALSDDARISGSASPALTLRQLTLGDAGTYTLEAVNAVGSTTMQTAVNVVGQELGLALNSPGWTWRTGGDVPWAWDVQDSHDGLGSAVSGQIGSGQVSYVETTLDGPLVVGFWWKVESQSWSTALRVLIDNVEIVRNPGSQVWQYQTVAVEAGSHVLRFEYIDPANSDFPSNRGWVDGVEIGTAVLPTITSQPPTWVSVLDVPVSMSVGITGTMPMSYQWLHDGVPLEGQTSAWLTLSSKSLASTGGYQVRVSNVAGTVLSATATVTFTQTGATPPTIVQQPKSVSVAPHSDVLFESAAAGLQPIAYQWFHDGIPMRGETNADLALADVQARHEGRYRVVATNPLGSVFSDEASLAVVNVAVWIYSGAPMYVPLSPVGIPANLKDVRQIAAGDSFCIALLGDGTLRCWGAYANYLEALATHERLSAVSAMGGGVVVLTEDGQAVRWGVGQPEPNRPEGASGLVSVAAGWTGNLGLCPDGSLVYWGNGDPVARGFSTWPTECVAVSAGSTALLADGTLYDWENIFGWAPPQPEGLTNLVSVAAGWDYRIVLDDTGRVSGFGTNSYGALEIPAGLSNVVQIVAGHGYCAALLENGSVVSWGMLPVSPQGLPGSLRNVVALAAGWLHCMALVGDGRPVFTVQPHGRTLTVGTAARLCAMAVGEGTLAYRWFRDGVQIPDASSKVLVVGSADVDQRGATFQCEVSNALGTVRSREIVVRGDAPTLPLGFDLGQTGFSPQGFVLKLTGFNPAAGPVVIESSPDLILWQPVSTNAPTGGEVVVTDGSAAGGARFYRASQRPQP